MATDRPGLRPDQDAYGELLLAFFEGRPADEIMERDDGFIHCGSPADYFAPYRRWPRLEKEAMRYVRGRVLDVGCGAGRVALHLQERGHEVVAIDNSPLALDVAKRRGVERTELGSLADIDESLGVFDTIVLIRNNFGLVGTEARAARLLRRLYAVTADRGRIVTDSVDPDRDDDPAYRAYRPRRADAGRPHAQRFRVRYREYATPWFHYLMLSAAEMERLVHASGWRVRRFLEDGSSRFVAVLEKASA